VIRANGRPHEELLEQAHAHPRLRQLFPWTGMGRLHFSCAEKRRTWGHLLQAARREGYVLDLGAVAHAGGGVGGTAAQEIAMVVEWLPPGCGPAFAGTMQAALNCEVAANKRSKEPRTAPRIRGILQRPAHPFTGSEGLRGRLILFSGVTKSRTNRYISVSYPRSEMASRLAAPRL
jgi:hypothetical protein